MDLYNKEFLINLKNIWDYMNINMPIEKCDLIIGCGCMNMQIPIKCSELLKEGYGKKILFTGGKGKISKDFLAISEADKFKEIAKKNKIADRDILIENKSTNTVDNFKFAKEIIKENNLKVEKILIVHNAYCKRRTLNCAKTVFPDKQLFITSPDTTFSSFIKVLNNNPQKIYNTISSIVGDIQRLIVYPQFGFQTKEDVPKNIIESYNYLKKKGYNKFILNKDDIDNLIKENGIIVKGDVNYFN